MAITSKEEFIEYCRRALGEPVIEINVAEEQIYDRVDEALLKFWDLHVDGSVKNFLMYPIQAIDLTNGYFPIPDRTLNVIKVHPQKNISTTSLNPDQLAFIQQVSVNAFDGIRFSGSLVPYLISQQYLNTLSNYFNFDQYYRFNRHQKRIYVDTDWSKFSANTYILFETQDKLLPEEYPDVWENQWLKKYATALIGEQWGINLSKYQGFQLPSGMTIDGSTILQTYQTKKQELIDELFSTYSLPCDFIIG